MKWIFSIIFCAFACYGQTNFYVSTTGSDSNPGTVSQPFATLECVRTNIRALDHPLTNQVNVWIRGGRYYRQNVYDLNGSQDSGTPTAPIIYRNYTGETPWLIGGLVSTNFVSVTNASVLSRLTASAQTNVLVSNLASQGITNLGTIINHGYEHAGYSDPNSSTLFQSELLFKDNAMQLARWPNALVTNPRTNWLLIAGSLTTNSFSYTNSTRSWAEPTNAWVQGFWDNDYSDSWEQVVSVDTNAQILTLNWPGAFGTEYNNAGAYRSGQRFFFFNIFEELDSAGEYYIDRLTTNVYFWPPSPIANGDCIVSTVSSNLIVLAGVSNVAFSGIVFEGSKMACVNINGGQSNLVDHCTFRGGSSDAVKILSSPQTGVSWCTISDMGERGVWIYGSGDRTTLTSGSNFVTYSTFTNIGRLIICQRPAIAATHNYGDPMNVVGVYMAHNLIRDMSHQSIQFYGNNNVIEYNEISRVCTETGDAGAIYCGSDPTFYGNVIRYNYIHDVTVGGGSDNYDGVKGIYLDGAMNGVTMFGNVLANVDHGIHVNGGRDNTIQNNIFVDCTNYLATKWPAFAINVNQTALANGFTNITSSYWQRLTNMPYQGTIWSNSYPNLARITNGPYVPNINICIATNNTIANNISFSNLVWILWQDQAAPVPQSADLTNAVVSNNLTNTDPLFVNYAARDFNLQESSPAWALGWVRIPLELIGPNPRYPIVGNVQTIRVGNMRMAQ